MALGKYDSDCADEGGILSAPQPNDAGLGDYDESTAHERNVANPATSSYYQSTFGFSSILGDGYPYPVANLPLLYLPSLGGDFGRDTDTTLVSAPYPTQDRAGLYFIESDGMSINIPCSTSPVNSDADDGTFGWPSEFRTLGIVYYGFPDGSGPVRNQNPNFIVSTYIFDSGASGKTTHLAFLTPGLWRLDLSAVRASASGTFNFYAVGGGIKKLITTISSGDVPDGGPRWNPPVAPTVRMDVPWQIKVEQSGMSGDFSGIGAMYLAPGLGTPGDINTDNYAWGNLYSVGIPSQNWDACIFTSVWKYTPGTLNPNIIGTITPVSRASNPVFSGGFALVRTGD